MARNDDEPFLSRWARRKQSQGQRKPVAPEAPEQPDPDSAEVPAPDEEAEAERQRMIEELPDPDSLSEQDDFTQFMQDGVPDDLRHRALQRLWRSNPIYAVRDGLNDYDLDYTDAATVMKGLKTAYQVGRGMVTQDERDAEAAAAAGGAQDDAGGADAAPAQAQAEDAAADAGAPDDAAQDAASEHAASDHTASGNARAAEAGDNEGADSQRPPRRLSTGGGAAPAAPAAEDAPAPKASVKGRAALRRWGGSDA